MRFFVPTMFRSALSFLSLVAAASAQSTSLQPAASGPVSIEQGGFKVYWEARLPIGAGESLKDGYLVDEVLYVSTDGGAVFSLQAETGLLRWGQILTDAAFTVFAPSHVQTADGRGPVVIPTTNQVYVKDRYTGNDLVRFRADFPIGSAAVGFDGVLLMGSLNGRLYSLGWDAARKADPVKRWDVDTGGPIVAAPILYGQRNLLIASQSGSVFSCQADNKQLTWKYKVGGAILGNPAMDAGGVYVPSLDRSLYKINANTGSLLWQARFPDPLRFGPAVTDQTVYQFTPSRGITALDAMTGKEKWQRQEARQFAAHGAGEDVLFVQPDRLLVVDHESGKVLATVSVPPSRGAIVNTVNDAVYLLAQSGKVLCLRRDKVPYLRRQQVEMAQDTLNSAPPAPGRSSEFVPPPTPPPPPREDPFRSRHDVPPPSRNP